MTTTLNFRDGHNVLKITYKNEYCDNNNVREEKDDIKMDEVSILDLENNENIGDIEQPSDVFCLTIQLYSPTILKRFSNRYTIFDISDIHPMFQHNSELLFDLIKNDEPVVNLINDIAYIKYVLQIRERKYNIFLELPELVEFGKDRQITVLKLKNIILVEKSKKNKKQNCFFIVIVVFFYFCLASIYIMLKQLGVHWNVDIL
jgi:hypothetical protein